MKRSHPDRYVRPSWLKKRLVLSDEVAATRALLRGSGLHTVCESGRCPNLTECFSRRRATFLILGKNCTRACAFCSVARCAPEPVDPAEPERLAGAVHTLGLQHVVITSVTRDDLADGGAVQFARAVAAVKGLAERITVEVLVPDFGGNASSVETVMSARPDVFGHNIETVERLYATVRSGADYDRSLNVLKRAASTGQACLIKSGIMLGLGETDAEVETALRDIRSAGCAMLTIGQYLMPAQGCAPVRKYYEPREFERFRSFALGLGFASVGAGPFVRSSYGAEEQFGEAQQAEVHA